MAWLGSVWEAEVLASAVPLAAASAASVGVAATPYMSVAAGLVTVLVAGRAPPAEVAAAATLAALAEVAVEREGGQLAVARAAAGCWAAVATSALAAEGWDWAAGKAAGAEAACSAAQTLPLTSGRPAHCPAEPRRQGTGLEAS